MSVVKSFAVAAVLSLLVLSERSNAFTPFSMKKSVFVGSSSRFMAEGENSDPVKMKSVLNKDILFDEKSGRFFESGADQADCIPEEEFCMVDKESGDRIRLTLEEKERIFMDALQAYYFNQKQTLSDEDFDLLKEDLTWNGSDKVQMNRKEGTYLAAVQSYLQGSPSMSDSDFDKLKQELKEEGSEFAVSREPQCYVDTGICKVTLKRDNFRNNLLYLPAGGILFLAWLGLGYELIEPIVPLNPLILTLLGAFPIYKGSIKITEDYIFQNSAIVYGPCPGCSAENRVYFGDILGVEGFSDISTTKCSKCKVVFNIQRNTLRASTIPKQVKLK